MATNDRAQRRANYNVNRENALAESQLRQPQDAPAQLAPVIEPGPDPRPLDSQPIVLGSQFSDDAADLQEKQNNINMDSQLLDRQVRDDENNGEVRATAVDLHDAFQSDIPVNAHQDIRSEPKTYVEVVMEGVKKTVMQEPTRPVKPRPNPFYDLALEQGEALRDYLQDRTPIPFMQNQHPRGIQVGEVEFIFSGPRVKGAFKSAHDASDQKQPRLATVPALAQPIKKEPLTAADPKGPRKTYIDLDADEEVQFFHSAKENWPPDEGRAGTSKAALERMERIRMSRGNPLFGTTSRPPTSQVPESLAKVQMKQEYWQPPWPAAHDSYYRGRYRLPPYGCSPSHPDALAVDKMYRDEVREEVLEAEAAAQLQEGDEYEVEKVPQPNKVSYAPAEVVQIVSPPADSDRERFDRLADEMLKRDKAKDEMLLKLMETIAQDRARSAERSRPSAKSQPREAEDLPDKSAETGRTKTRNVSRLEHDSESGGGRISINTKLGLPTFLPQEGIKSARSYCRALIDFYLINQHLDGKSQCAFIQATFKGNTNCFTFVATHRKLFLDLSFTEHHDFINAIGNGYTVSDQISLFAALPGSAGALASTLKAQPVELGMAAQVSKLIHGDRSKQDYQGDPHGRRWPALLAFTLCVEKVLGDKPLPGEVQLALNLKQGKKSDFHDAVPELETPSQFLIRCCETRQWFDLSRSTGEYQLPTVLEMFTNGITKELKQLYDSHKMQMNVSYESMAARLAAIGSLCDNFHNNIIENKLKQVKVGVISAPPDPSTPSQQSRGGASRGQPPAGGGNQRFSSRRSFPSSTAMTTVQDQSSERSDGESAALNTTLVRNELPAPPTGKVSDPSKLAGITGYGPKPRNGGRPSAIMGGGGVRGRGNGPAPSGGRGGRSTSVPPGQTSWNSNQPREVDSGRTGEGGQQSSCWFCLEPGHREKDCEMKAKFRNQLISGKQNQFNSHPKQQDKSAAKGSDKPRWTPRNSSVAASAALKPRGPSTWEDRDDELEARYYGNNSHYANVSMIDLEGPEPAEGYLESEEDDQICTTAMVGVSEAPSLLCSSQEGGDCSSDDRDLDRVGYDCDNYDEDPWPDHDAGFINVIATMDEWRIKSMIRTGFVVNKAKMVNLHSEVVLQAQMFELQQAIDDEHFYEEQRIGLMGLETFGPFDKLVAEIENQVKGLPETYAEKQWDTTKLYAMFQVAASTLCEIAQLRMQNLFDMGKLQEQGAEDLKLPPGNFWVRKNPQWFSIYQRLVSVDQLQDLHTRRDRLYDIALNADIWRKPCVTEKSHSHGGTCVAYLDISSEDEESMEYHALTTRSDFLILDDEDESAKDDERDNEKDYFPSSPHPDIIQQVRCSQVPMISHWFGPYNSWELKETLHRSQLSRIIQQLRSACDKLGGTLSTYNQLDFIRLDDLCRGDGDSIVRKPETGSIWIQPSDWEFEHKTAICSIWSSVNIYSRDLFQSLQLNTHTPYWEDRGDKEYFQARHYIKGRTPLEELLTERPYQIHRPDLKLSPLMRIRHYVKSYQLSRDRGDRWNPSIEDLVIGLDRTFTSTGLLRASIQRNALLVVLSLMLSEADADIMADGYEPLPQEMKDQVFTGVRKAWMFIEATTSYDKEPIHPWQWPEWLPESTRVSCHVIEYKASHCEDAFRHQGIRWHLVNESQVLIPEASPGLPQTEPQASCSHSIAMTAFVADLPDIHNEEMQWMELDIGGYYRGQQMQEKQPHQLAKFLAILHVAYYYLEADDIMKRENFQQTSQLTLGMEWTEELFRQRVCFLHYSIDKMIRPVQLNTWERNGDLMDLVEFLELVASFRMADLLDRDTEYWKDYDPDGLYKEQFLSIIAPTGEELPPGFSTARLTLATCKTELQLITPIIIDNEEKYGGKAATVSKADLAFDFTSARKEPIVAMTSSFLPYQSRDHLFYETGTDLHSAERKPPTELPSRKRGGSNGGSKEVARTTKTLEETNFSSLHQGWSKVRQDAIAEARERKWQELKAKWAKNDASTKLKMKSESDRRIRSNRTALEREARRLGMGQKQISKALKGNQEPLVTGRRSSRVALFHNSDGSRGYYSFNNPDTDEKCVYRVVYEPVNLAAQMEDMRVKLRCNKRDWNGQALVRPDGSQTAYRFVMKEPTGEQSPEQYLVEVVSLKEGIKEAWMTNNPPSPLWDKNPKVAGRKGVLKQEGHEVSQGLFQEAIRDEKLSREERLMDEHDAFFRTHPELIGSESYRWILEGNCFFSHEDRMRGISYFTLYKDLITNLPAWERILKPDQSEQLAWGQAETLSWFILMDTFKDHLQGDRQLVRVAAKDVSTKDVSVAHKLQCHEWGLIESSSDRESSNWIQLIPLKQWLEDHKPWSYSLAQGKLIRPKTKTELRAALSHLEQHEAVLGLDSKRIGSGTVFDRISRPLYQMIQPPNAWPTEKHVAYEFIMKRLVEVFTAYTEKNIKMMSLQWLRAKPEFSSHALIAVQNESDEEAEHGSEAMASKFQYKAPQNLREQRRYPSSYAPPYVSTLGEMGLQLPSSNKQRERERSASYEREPDMLAPKVRVSRARPESFTIRTREEAPTPAQYHQYLRTRSKLLYLQQPRGRPEASVSLEINGVLHNDFLTLLDIGANINIMTRNLADRLGISVLPTKHMLSTSTQKESAGVMGITPIIPLIYGDEENGGFRTYHQFLISDSKLQNIYELLLSSVDCQQFQGIIDTEAMQYTLKLPETARQVLADECSAISNTRRPAQTASNSISLPVQWRSPNKQKSY